jgi:hypothetical protein
MLVACRSGVILSRWSPLLNVTRFRTRKVPQVVRLQRLAGQLVN